MSSLIEPAIKEWASPKEFDAEKEIVVEGFRVMTVDEIIKEDGRAPLYPPFDGKGRRWLFRQQGFYGVRRLDVNAPAFQNDLARYGIQVGSKGRLRRVPREGRKGFNWIFTKNE